jgi:hypothetical protein
MRFASRQDVEGKREQTIAGENSSRFVEFLVSRRLPAPQGTKSPWSYSTSACQ